MKYGALLLSLLTFWACSMPDIPDVIPPVVAIMYPYEGAVLTSDTDIIIQVSDDQGIAKVWYYVDGVKQEEKTVSPYTFTLKVSQLQKNQDHVIQAGAQDKDGNVAFTLPIRFHVSASSDLTPPEVTILSPQNGQQVNGTVQIYVQASDDRAIQKVALYVDDDSVAVDYSYPYILEWNTTNYPDSVPHNIFVRAFDSANNSAVSQVITLTIYQSPVQTDHQAPTALFLYPVANNVVSGNVQVSVFLSDNVGIEKAEFFVDGQLINSANAPASPWNFTWNSSAQADSALHSLFVRVTDYAGNVGNSGVLTVTVD